MVFPISNHHTGILEFSEKKWEMGFMILYNDMIFGDKENGRK
jgi:hypothetical protein